MLQKYIRKAMEVTAGEENDDVAAARLLYSTKTAEKTMHFEDICASMRKDSGSGLSS